MKKEKKRAKKPMPNFIPDHFEEKEGTSSKRSPIVWDISSKKTKTDWDKDNKLISEDEEDDYGLKKGYNLINQNKINNIFELELSDNTIYCMINILDKEALAILDTGATYTVISEGDLESLEVKVMDITPVLLRGINKTITIRKGTLLPIKIGNDNNYVFRQIQALVIPGSASILLGMNFVKEFGVRYDGKTGKATAPVNGKYMEISLGNPPKCSKLNIGG